MELLITCRFCGTQETVFVTDHYALVECECGETNEVDIAEVLENESQATSTKETATA